MAVDLPHSSKQRAAAQAPHCHCRLVIGMFSVSMPETVGGRPRCLIMSQTSSALSPCGEGHRLRRNHHTTGVLLPNSRKSARSPGQYCQLAPGLAEPPLRVSWPPSLHCLLWGLEVSVVSGYHHTNAIR